MKYEQQTHTRNTEKGSNEVSKVGFSFFIWFFIYLFLLSYQLF
jgi:hypothetical protein